MIIFFFKQKSAYDMRISDWSSDVCSSDLFLVIVAALYERLFVIEPDFAAVTAPEIRIYAPTDGELAPHEFDPGDTVKRDQVLVEVNDPEAEAQLVLAEATLNYNERMLENLRASLANGGSATILTGGGADRAPVPARKSAGRGK